MRYARQNHRSRALRALGFGAAFVLAACSELPDYQGPTFSFLTGYGAASDSAPVLVANDAWWQRLEDPTLNRLMDEALAGNLDLAVATDRVAEARAARGTVSTPFGAQSSISRTGRDSTNGPRSRQGTLDVDFSWLFDPYGARVAEDRAALGRIDVAEAELSAARLLVIFNMSNAYLDLRFNQRQLHLRQQELVTRRRTLGLTRQLAEVDEATRLETTRSRARVAEIEAQLPNLRAAVAATRNQIAVLAGLSPGTLNVNLDQGGIPMPRLAPQVGIPADLLRNRPDLQVAERRYYVAVAEVGQAEAARYPQLSLGGAISLALIGADAGAASAVFGPQLDLPDLPGEAATARVAARHALARQAQNSWRANVLQAILEVENALLTYDAATSSAQSAARASRLYREALTLTREVFSVGEATLTDLIAAEEALAASNATRAEIAYRRAQSFIELNVRIGAGHGVNTAGLALTD